MKLPPYFEVRLVGVVHRAETLTHTPCRVSGAPRERGASCPPHQGASLF